MKEISTIVVTVMVSAGLTMAAMVQAREHKAGDVTHKTYLGKKNANVKSQTINYKVYEFPGKGSRLAWKTALTFSRRADQAEEAGKLDECIELYGDAIETYPYYADFYNCKACGHYARSKPGDLAEGVRLIRMAIKLDPESCMFWDNLAKGLCDQGKLKESRKAIKNALKYCQNNKKKEKELRENIEILNKAIEKQERKSKQTLLHSPKNKGQ